MGGNTWHVDYDSFFSLLDNSYTTELGKVAKIVGLTIESVGPSCKLNDLCKIKSRNELKTSFFEV